MICDGATYEQFIDDHLEHVETNGLIVVGWPIDQAGVVIAAAAVENGPSFVARMMQEVRRSAPK